MSDGNGTDGGVRNVCDCEGLDEIDIARLWIRNATEEDEDTEGKPV